MIKVVITTAGRQAIINAQETGTNAVQIAKIGVGTGRYTPSENQTALQAQIKQLDIIEGGTAGDNSIHVAYEDDSTDAYAVYEFGLFLTDGTLFAVYSSNNLLIQKTESSTALLAVDIALVDIDVENITFGDVSFTTAAATTTQAGVIEIATASEVTAGDSNQLAITPQNIKALTATATRAGLVELATNAEATAGTDTVRAVPPAGVKAAIDDRLATDAETITGTDDTKTVTPAGLSARTATTSRTGLVELATSAEAVTGTDETKAVTPAAMWDAIEDSKDYATTTAPGVIELATDSEAMAGTDATRAITPASLKAGVANYSGEINSAKVIATGSTTARTLADRFADGITIKDFGAKGDGTTNDTAAFAALENRITGRDIDLEGLTYVVTSRPTANNYFNGYFKVNGVIVQPVYDFYKYGGTAHDMLNVFRDFTEYTRGGGALISGNYAREGVSAGATVASAIWDDVNRYFYTLHVASGNTGGIINRFSCNRLGAKVEHAANAYTTSSPYIGIQGLGIQYMSGGTVKLWASMAYEAAGASVTSKGTKAVRFSPPTQNNQNVDNSVEIFNLFPEVSGSNQATTVCVSYSGKYLIAKYNASGNGYRVRVFRLRDLNTAGDYSDKYINEFTIDLTRDITGGVEKSLRSIACDDRFIYFLAAGTQASEKHSIYVTDMYGNVIQEYRDLSVGKEIAAAIGSATYTPRSLFFISLNGQPKLCLQVSVGDTTGDRACHVIALNARQSYYFPTGSTPGATTGVAIDEQGRITNAEGILNFSVYPSGTAQYTQARVGANQMTLARFGADNLGSSIAFYKSRGADIAQSKSVLPSDVVGGLNFIVDNGNVDYEGQAIGASIGRIVGVVYPTSTITENGTTALGVRGAVRIYANSDGGNIEATKGLEITDEAARPTTDKEIYSGTANRRWKAVYAMTDVINTSDANEKQDILDIPDEALAVWENIEYKSFRYRDDVEAMGNNAPTYFGVIAQDVIAVFNAAGMDATKLGLINVETDEDGVTHYGVRYSQVQIFEAAYMRWKIKNISVNGGDMTAEVIEYNNEDIIDDTEDLGDDSGVYTIVEES